MKKIIFLVLLVWFNFNYSQTKNDDSYENLSKQNKILLEKLQKDQAAKSLRVENYLKLNPNKSKFIKGENGSIMEIVDVINGRPIYYSTFNLEAARATKTTALQSGGSLGLSLDGTDITVGVWDGGPVQDTHPEFQNADNTGSRVTNVDNIIVDGDEGSYSYHATHVSGTIGAKGVADAAKGMAPNVSIKSYNWSNDMTEMLQAITDPTNPIILSNHSYGVPVDPNDGSGPIDSWIMGAYTGDSQNVDDLIHSNPQYLMVASAGNSGGTSYPDGLLTGYDKLTTDKTSKNNLVVANANPTLAPFTYEITGLVINGGSSQGPTDDLRIKPDIAADGTNLYSSIPTNEYAVYSGTSMSAPNTTGTLVLLQEYYKQLNGGFMLGSTLKGLVCHTATDDSATSGPDPKFGWGFLNAEAAANVIADADNGVAVIDELTIDNNGSYTLTFSATAGDVLSATICWTDMPGAAVSSSSANNLNNPTPRLVNDLDLRITKDGETYFPWMLDFSSGTQFLAVKGDNIVDNIERVDIEVPESGAYTLTVTHKGTLQGNEGGFFDPQSQDFSLIVTGNNLTLGTTDNALSSNLVVYPNPNKGMFTISFDSNLENTNDVVIDIHDISGRAVYKNTFINNSVRFNETINLTGVAPGVYIANISQGSNVTSQKIVIE